MDAKLILTDYDLRELPLEWFTEEERALERRLKEAVGSRWDNSRLMLEYAGTYFSLMISQQSCAPNSIYHKRWRHVPGFAFVGEPNSWGGRDTNIWSVHLWNASGQIALLSITFMGDPEQPMWDTQRKAILEACKAYMQDRMLCSGCGKEMSVSENKQHHYFAGRYCQECWEREYRQKEANESYN